MLFRLFAKKAFEPIDKELNQVFMKLGISPSNIKIRKTPATYFKPYSCIVEGSFNGYRFVLSLHSPALSKETVPQQLELIIYCENPNWISLEVHKKGQTISQTKTLGMDLIEIEQLNAKDVVVECNQMAFVEAAFDKELCEELLEMSTSSFFKVERGRLYYTVDSLPENAVGRSMLLHAMNIGITLAMQVDRWAI
jgi:hypothetical protein